MQLRRFTVLWLVAAYSLSPMKVQLVVGSSGYGVTLSYYDLSHMPDAMPPFLSYAA